MKNTGFYHLPPRRQAWHRRAGLSPKRFIAAAPFRGTSRLKSRYLWVLAGHFFTVHFAAPGERQGNGELKGRKARGSVTLAAGAGSTGCTDGGQRAHVRFMNGPVAHNRQPWFKVKVKVNPTLLLRSKFLKNAQSGRAVSDH